MWSWQRGFVNRHRIMSVFIQLSIHCLLYHCRVLVMQTSFTEANILWFQKGFWNFSSQTVSERFTSVIYFLTYAGIHTLIHGDTKRKLYPYPGIRKCVLSSTTYWRPKRRKLRRRGGSQDYRWDSKERDVSTGRRRGRVGVLCASSIVKIDLRKLPEATLA